MTENSFSQLDIDGNRFIFMWSYHDNYENMIVCGKVSMRVPVKSFIYFNVPLWINILSKQNFFSLIDKQIFKRI